MSKLQEQVYCRHCGEGKGHSTAACTNLAEIKKNLASTDGELQSALSRLKDLEQSDKERHRLAEQNLLLHRIMLALLDLVETRRP